MACTEEGGAHLDMASLALGAPVAGLLMSPSGLVEKMHGGIARLIVFCSNVESKGIGFGYTAIRCGDWPPCLAPISGNPGNSS